MTTSNSSRFSRVITIANDKGGVFKTSLTSNIAALHAATGRRTLIIDTDPQGNITEDLGFWEQSDDGEALASSVLSSTPIEPLRNVRENLDVASGGQAFKAVISALARQELHTDPELLLASSLAPIAGNYELIIIDSPPQQDDVQKMCMATSRWLLTPSMGDASSRKGLRPLVEKFVAAKQINPTLEFMGVVLVGIPRGATAQEAEARAGIAQDLGDDSLVFSQVISQSRGVALGARENGLAVHEYADRGGSDRHSATRLASDYMALTMEILRRMASREAIV